MPDLPAIWPADRLSSDHSVEDRIHNAVMAERERCAKIAEGEIFGCEGMPEGIEIANRIRGKA